MHDHLRRTMGLEPERLRVVSGDVGGAFGMRTAPYPEYPALLIAARHIGRPVRWLASRSECFLSDNQARDTYVEAALALDREGRFLGLRIDGLANMGAYLTSHAAFISTVNFTRCLPGMYRHSGISRCGSAACSPTPCRPAPTAAPAGPRPITASSGWSTRRRGRAASTASNCAGAT